MKGYHINEVFAACPPGLESVLLAEINDLDLPLTKAPKQVIGGVELDCPDRQACSQVTAETNLWLRSATRVLARLARFPVHHLAQLDKRARRIDWAEVLPADCRLKVEATCHRSRIYHSDAAATRVFKAAADGAQAHPGGGTDEDHFKILVRIERDLCTVSVDTSGAPLYQRGAKLETAKAPLRENLAAGLLQFADWCPEAGEALMDPMCGSGSFLLEAVSLACHRAPGAQRHFAFENLKTHEPERFAAQKEKAEDQALSVAPVPISGSDNSGGAVGATQRNLERAGFANLATVQRLDVSEVRPAATTGLMIVNPPYGKRLGRESRDQRQLYGELGRVFREYFAGWRLALLTAHGQLAQATGLDFKQVSVAIPHGGLRVKLYRHEP